MESRETAFEGFCAFCRNATDAQLRAIIEKEWAAKRWDDYRAAALVGVERGWHVCNGKVE